MIIAFPTFMVSHMSVFVLIHQTLGAGTDSSDLHRWKCMSGTFISQVLGVPGSLVGLVL